MIRKRIFETIAHWACVRHTTVLAVAVLLTVLSWLPPLLIGMGSSFSIARMLPQDVPAARAFTRTVIDFGSLDTAIVVFHLEQQNEQGVRLAGRAADRIVDEIQKHPDIITAYCRKFRPEEKDYLLNTELPRRGLLLLPPESLETVKDRLQPSRIARSVRKTARRMESAMTNEKHENLAALDALGLGTVIRSSLGNLNGKFDTGKGDAYLVDKNRTMLLAIIQPRRPAQKREFSVRIMEHVRAVTERVLAEEPPGARAAYTVEFGGGYEIASRYSARVNGVLVDTLLTSLICVILLFGICFRRYGVLLYIGIPLVMIVSWTIGLGWLIFGQLNIISCGFAAVLVGLGVDYAIHIYNRYIEERVNGHPLEEAFRLSLLNTGWGVFVGMVTTCLAFFALLGTRFNQLSQFGVLAGVGIALSVPGMLFVLPALIALRNRLRAEHSRTLLPSALMLPQVATVITKRYRTVLFVGSCLLLIGVGNLILRPESLAFDQQINNLRPDERAFELGGEIAKAFTDRNPNKLMLLVTGDTEEATLEKAAHLQSICRELKKEGLLLNYSSVLSMLPSPSAQRERMAILQSIDFDAALRAFREALQREGLREDVFQLNIDLLKQHAALAKAGTLILPSDYFDTSLWRFVKRQVTQRRQLYYLKHDTIPAEHFPLTLAMPAITRDGEELYPAGTTLNNAQVEAMRKTVKSIHVLDKGWVVKINIYPPIIAGSRTADLNIDDAWLAVVRKRLGMDSSANGVYLTGMSLLVHELAGVVKDDFIRVSLYVFGVAVLALALFFHRHPQRVAFCLLPVVVGLLGLLGLMSIFAVPFNFVNVLAIPIIIGLGVDNGIHLVNRFYESHRQIRPMLVDTGRAIMITTLTSMIGFGSLAVGGYRGITSMGILSILALGTNLVVSLVFFPAFLRVFSPPEEAPVNPDEDRD